MLHLNLELFNLFFQWPCLVQRGLDISHVIHPEFQLIPVESLGLQSYECTELRVLKWEHKHCFYYVYRVEAVKSCHTAKKGFDTPELTGARRALLLQVGRQSLEGFRELLIVLLRHMRPPGLSKGKGLIQKEISVG